MQARPSSRDPIGGVLFSRLHLKAGLEVVIEFSLIVGFCLPHSLQEADVGLLLYRTL